MTCLFAEVTSLCQCFKISKHGFFVFNKSKVTQDQITGSLSTRVFETRTATGSVLFSLLTCFHTTTFTFPNIFYPLEIISIKIWETPLPWHAKFSLPVDVRVNVPVLPNRRGIAILKGHRQPVSFARLCCCYYPGNRIGRFASETSREEELLRIRCSICFLIQTPSSFRFIILTLK